MSRQLTPVTNVRSEISTALQVEISGAFKRLLSTKHLYQFEDLNLSEVTKIAEREVEDIARRKAAITIPTVGGTNVPTLEFYMENIERWILTDWWPNGGRTVEKIGAAEAGDLTFVLPTISTTCTNKDCGGRWPFNPILDQIHLEHGRARSDQAFLLSYECQNCKGQPVRFLVRRTGRKLQLCGRDPLELPEVPKELPKGQSEHFSRAHIAFNAGQVLAAIFLLRVFVEQFWRSLPEVQALLRSNEKARGDVIGAAYRDLLPVNFRDQFPSLGSVYQRLSDAMHSAKATAEVFTTASDDIVLHFQAWRNFERSGAKLGPQPRLFLSRKRQHPSEEMSPS